MTQKKKQSSGLLRSYRDCLVFAAGFCVIRKISPSFVDQGINNNQKAYPRGVLEAEILAPQ